MPLSSRRQRTTTRLMSLTFPAALQLGKLKNRRNSKFVRPSSCICAVCAKTVCPFLNLPVTSSISKFFHRLGVGEQTSAGSARHGSEKGQCLLRDQPKAGPEREFPITASSRRGAEFRRPKKNKSVVYCKSLCLSVSARAYLSSSAVGYDLPPACGAGGRFANIHTTWSEIGDSALCLLDHSLPPAQ